MNSNVLYVVGMFLRWLGCAGLTACAFVFAFLFIGYFATREDDWSFLFKCVGVSFAAHAVGSMIVRAPLFHRAKHGRESRDQVLDFVAWILRWIGIVAVLGSICFWVVFFLFFFGSPLPDIVSLGFFLALPAGLFVLLAGTQMAGDVIVRDVNAPGAGRRTIAEWISRDDDAST